MVDQLGCKDYSLLGGNVLSCKWYSDGQHFCNYYCHEGYVKTANHVYCAGKWRANTYWTDRPCILISETTAAPPYTGPSTSSTARPTLPPLPSIIPIPEWTTRPPPTRAPVSDFVDDGIGTGSELYILAIVGVLVVVLMATAVFFVRLYRRKPNLVQVNFHFMDTNDQPVAMVTDEHREIPEIVMSPPAYETITDSPPAYEELHVNLPSLHNSHPSYDELYSTDNRELASPPSFSEDAGKYEDLPPPYSENADVTLQQIPSTSCVDTANSAIIMTIPNAQPKPTERRQKPQPRNPHRQINQETNVTDTHSRLYDNNINTQVRHARSQVEERSRDVLNRGRSSLNTDRTVDDNFNSSQEALRVSRDRNGDFSGMARDRGLPLCSQPVTRQSPAPERHLDLATDPSNPRETMV